MLACAKSALADGCETNQVARCLRSAFGEALREPVRALELDRLACRRYELRGLCVRLGSNARRFQLRVVKLCSNHGGPSAFGTDDASECHAGPERRAMRASIVSS
jgi:hypothetical protein